MIAVSGMSEWIEVCANGQNLQLAAATPLSELLAAHGYRPGQVVVEHNGRALTPREAENCVLGDGDRLELVRIVAGG